MARVNDFDKVAPVYDKLSAIVFGNALLKAQLHFLNELDQARTVLVIGGGTGEVALSLLELNNNVVITYVESSLRMMEAARKRCKPFSERVIFVHSKIEDVKNLDQYDGIITAFFLDMFSNDEVAALRDRLIRQLKGDGKWIATDFTHSRKLFHRLLLRSMYLFFRVVARISVERLPEWEEILASRMKAFATRDFYSGFVRSVAYTNG